MRIFKEHRAKRSGPLRILPRDGAVFKGSFWPGGKASGENDNGILELGQSGVNC
jgi:hypothetical protein